MQLVVRTEIGWLDDEGLVMHSNYVAGKVLLHFIIFHKDCATDKSWQHFFHTAAQYKNCPIVPVKGFFYFNNTSNFSLTIAQPRYLFIVRDIKT